MILGYLWLQIYAVIVLSSASVASGCCSIFGLSKNVNAEEICLGEFD